ncbi:MAG: long-chain fatty acid--CoA ligase, partial [Burkholderiales bacterium]
MDRFWLERYPAGVPHDIDHHQYESVVQLMDEAFAKYRNRKAYVGFGKEISYGDLDEMSKCMAAWLQSRGLQKGDRVAL